MPPGAQGGGGAQEDSSIGLLWVVIGFMVLCAVVWYSYKVQIILGWLQMKSWELWFINLFVGLDSINEAREILGNIDPESLSFSDLMVVSKIVGNSIRIPCVVMLVLMGAIIYSTNTVRKFKTSYSMATLADKEQGNWPQIMPVLGKGILQQNIDEGQWAMALTPLEFCKRHKLIEVHKRKPSELDARDKSKVDLVLRRGDANKVFLMQLGPRWSGLKNMPMHVKALFAVFAARISNDNKTSVSLLQQFSASARTKIDYSGVLPICEKYYNNKEIKKIISSHAYLLTVMASMLAVSRLDGVLATADFIWLKTVDRGLWYMLNNVGRQTAFVESAGPFAHWLAEKEAHRKLITPMIEAATDALELALRSIVYNPEDSDM